MDDNVLTLENEYQEDVDLEGEVYAVGERGYSAYEVAVRNGFIGTEEEWLASLVGATPDIDIGTVERGETAAATITGTPEEPLLNLVLPKGDTGAQGPAGPNGITPTIGDNGNWYLGETDTGKPSRGPKGDQGDPAPEYESGVGINIDSDDKINVTMPVILSEKGYSSNDPLIISECIPGVYFFEYQTNSTSIFIKAANASSHTVKEIEISQPILVLTDTTVDLNSSEAKIVGSIYGTKEYSKGSALLGTNNLHGSGTISVTGSTGAVTIDMHGSLSVDVGSASTIIGKKTFSKIPTASGTPSANGDLTTKKYVDEHISSVSIQVSTMPTATGSTVGKIYQYIGETDSNYTKGYFYVGVSDGGDPATYSWEQISTQPGGSSYVAGSGITIDNNTINVDMPIKVTSDGNASTNPFVVDEHTPGVYFIKVVSDKIYLKTSDLNENTKINTIDCVQPILILTDTDIDPTSSMGQRIGYLSCIKQIPYSVPVIGPDNFHAFAPLRAVGSTGTITFEIATDTSYVSIDPRRDSAISGEKTFTTKIPKLGATLVPTDSTHLVNKGYVDSLVSQVSTMPTASADTVGKIYQYTGATDSNYTNGYFYIGTTDGASTPTYSWEQLNVQPAGGSGSSEVKGVHLLNTYNNYMYHTYFANWEATGEPSWVSSIMQPSLISIINDYIEHYNEDASYNMITVYVHSNVGNTNLVSKIENWNNTPTPSSFNTYDDYFDHYERHSIRPTYTDGVCTAVNVITITARVEDNGYPLRKNNSTQWTPTGDYNPATKKYVDDAVAGAGGSATPFYHIEMQTTSSSNFENYPLTETDKSNLADIINDAYTNGYSSISMLVTAKDGYQPAFVTTNSSRTVAWSDIQSKPTVLQFYNVSIFNPFYPGGGLPTLTTRVLTVYLSWSGDVATIGNNTKIESITTGILTTVNEGAYTPTSYYHPATKGYVDDKIWVGTQAEYDALSTHSSNVIYFIKETT